MIYFELVYFWLVHSDSISYLRLILYHPPDITNEKLSPRELSNMSRVITLVKVVSLDENPFILTIKPTHPSPTCYLEVHSKLCTGNHC